MFVGVYSLKKTLFEDEAVSINCQTDAGEITVLDQHAPLVTILKPGAIKIIDTENKEHFFESHGGFLEVGAKNTAKLIIQE